MGYVSCPTMRYHPTVVAQKREFLPALQDI
jgi:hypothetical protein